MRLIIILGLIGLIGFVATVVIGYFALVAATDKANEAANDAHKAQKQAQAQSNARYRERLADQQRTDVELRNVVCLALQIPKGTPRVAPNIAKLREQFKCPKGPFTPQPLPTISKRTTDPPQPGRTNPSPTPAKQSRNHAVGPSAKPGPTRTVISVSPGPTKTKTVSPSPTRIRPTPSATPPLLCQLLGKLIPCH